MKFSKLTEIPKILRRITPNVWHYEAMQQTNQYIVWAEDGEGSSVEANDRKTEQSITGTIDLFTMTEFDPAADAIQDVLKENRISFYLNSVQYENRDDGYAGYIHYEWVFEVA